MLLRDWLLNVRQSGRVGHEVSAATLLEVIQTVDLAGHFQIIAIDRIMPTFDVDAAFESALAQLGNDVGPIAVTKAGCAMEGKLLGTVDAELLDDVPLDRCVFAMDVEDAIHVFAKLRHGVDELDHLVTGFPFQADILCVNGIEH